MISRTYVISSSIAMSRHYVRRNPNLGYTPSSFRDFILELYNHPLYLLENDTSEALNTHQQDLSMCRIRNNLSEENYFYHSMEYRGNRLLIFRALEELDISFTGEDADSFTLPYSAKDQSLRELYRLYKEDDVSRYSSVLNSVIDRVGDGLYDAVFDGIELLLLDEFEVKGREQNLLELLKEKVTTVDFASEKTKIDFDRVGCSSSITAGGNINKAFKWMREIQATSDNTVFAALDYDTYAPELYKLRDMIPVYLDKGILCRHFSCFEDFLTGLKEKQMIYREDPDQFLEKTEALLAGRIKDDKTPELDGKFYTKVMSAVGDLKTAAAQYSELDIPVDVYELLVEQISSLRFSSSDLAMKEEGFSLYDLQDLYALESLNVVVLGLSHSNYPKKKKIDPLLKLDERLEIQKSIRGSISINSVSYDHMLDWFLARSNGRILLTYESHDSDTGKFTVPSGFFNKVLKSRGRETRIKEIYKLCGVKESYAADLEDQGDYLPVFPNKKLAESNRNRQKRIYSPDIEDLDYGVSEEYVTELSASSLELFYKCPYAFHLKYNKKLYPPDWGEPDKSVWLDAMTRGSLLHLLYEQALTPFIGSGQKYLDYIRSVDDKALDKIIDKGLHAERRNDPPFIEHKPDVSDQVKQRELAEIKENLKRFFDKEADRNDPFYPVALEEKFKFTSAIGGDQIDFEGYIDRIDSDGFGNFRVVDYKTGRNPFSSSRQYLFSVEGKKDKGDKYFFQHAIYSRALSTIGKFKPLESIQAGYYFSSDRGDWSTVLHTGVSPGEKLDLILETYLSEVKKGKYFKNASQCAFCDYKPFCKNIQKKRRFVRFEQLDNLADAVGETYA